ncbi:hypothetical protein EV06_0907 [Prochlorococcus sp. MIT 0602]|nr:hypothetical protein EV06_0907 [Prochlorococcus sp. MIT 0602]KGG17315.1 hypothetical protein EV07_0753 [Prochlorococcus sp. MIT 0603]
MKGDGSSTYFQPIFKGKLLILTFLIAWLSISLCFIRLGIDPILNKFLN